MTDQKLSLVVSDTPPASNGNKAPVDFVELLHLTETGNATRLVERHGEDLLYVPLWKRWLAWDGMRFARDETQEIVRRAQDTVLALYSEAQELPSQAEREALVKHALRSESGKALREMIEIARSRDGIATTPTRLDVDPDLFNCANGTIDLRTGELREHRRGDLLTKRSPVHYEPDAEAPMFHSFLRRIMDNSEEKIDFLQRALGYTMTGNTGEEVCFIAYGRGRNGKSKFLGAVSHVLGDYAEHARPETFMARDRDKVANDIAALVGARFVATVEVEEGHRLGEALVKQMTGGDLLTARFLYAEWFSFKPLFKIWMAANHKPGIRGTDEAIWERIRLIPFTVTIPLPERDTRLAGKLESEGPGILAWMVEGCLRWRHEGLAPPIEVVEATQGYRDEMDVLAHFIEDRCVVNADAQALAGELYRAYVDWCGKAGERPLTQVRFGKALAERGFHPDRLPTVSRSRYWEGIGLREEESWT